VKKSLKVQKKKPVVSRIQKEMFNPLWGWAKDVKIEVKVPRGKTITVVNTPNNV
jgi:hypothetical protein